MGFLIYLCHTTSIMKKILQISCYVLLCAFLMPSVYNTADAQLRDRQKYVTEEDIAIAFFKAGNITPNIKSWIELNEPYKSTPWARRGLVMETETKRLQSKLREYDISKKDLRLRTFAKINLETKQMENERGVIIEKHYLNIDFLNNPDAFYFPYSYSNENYALMPFGLQEMMREEISKEEYEFYNDITNPNSKYSFILNLRAREAMTEHPIELDHNQLWVLKTNIASAELWSDKNNLIWEYTAPWYTSPQLKELQDIYDLKPRLSESIGNVKPFTVKKE